MKKLIFYLLLSSFASAQNIALLQKANNADEAFSKTFTQDIYPNYQTIDSYNEGLNYTYVLVPENTSKNDIEDCRIGNPCKMGVSVVYKVIDGNYIFSSAKGDGESLFAFWQKNVEPSANLEKSKEPHPIYFYKNPEQKIWWNFWKTDGGHWMIRNMSNRL
ncbi:hypothetical protein [Chryseobacterium sp. R2A-55]|uniref:hypothetical protein n=1 Tax=Chryseobacterium sp. R2A-55 TaxID=2744445 RepID=UPI001F48C226|nr:hypothetical protein [Chryseobacterium sp. R2A-55]